MSLLMNVELVERKKLQIEVMSEPMGVADI
jgi:hypothetical protein